MILAISIMFDGCLLLVAIARQRIEPKIRSRL